MRPFLALAGGLAAAGHRVTLAVTSVEGRDYAPLAAALGVRLLQPGREYFLADARRFDRLYRRILPVRSTFRQLRMIWEEMYLPVVAEIQRAAVGLCRETEAVVGNFGVHPLAAAAEAARLPHAAVYHFQGAIPTGPEPPEDMPDLGPWLNRLVWRLARGAMNRAFLPEVNSFRRTLGLPPVRDVLLESWRSPSLNLVAVSPLLLNPRADFGPTFRFCGYLNLPGATQAWEAPAGWEEFLAAGPPPVFISFGSMLAFAYDPAEIRATLSLLEAAARLAGCRAVVQGPWEAGDAAGAPPGIFRLGKAPHDLVLPRCAAVVHHGGAGTTQAAVRSGRPSVVVAHVVDQRYWGLVLAKRGLAPPPLRRWKLRPATLAAAIRRVRDDPALAARAAAVGEAMRAEDGVARAVAALEEWRARPSRSP